MAGYTEQTRNGEYIPLSVLFVREAGAQSRIDGYVKVEESVIPSGDMQSKRPALTMVIDGQTFAIDVSSEKLTRKQTDTFLNALVAEKPIVFRYAEALTWDLSQRGSFAVMLKMDAYQKRIGTVGAVFKKGGVNERDVLPAAPVPVVVAPKVNGASGSKALPGLPELFLSAKQKASLRSLLGNNYGESAESECWADAEEVGKSLVVYRLNDDMAIASQLCWAGAYNFADAFWLVRPKAPFEPQFIAAASRLALDNDGTLRIYNDYKGRGAGDCWGHDEWVWDGQGFVDVSHTDTGLCRGFAGGAWNLPGFVSEVIVQKSPESTSGKNGDKDAPLDPQTLGTEFAIALQDGRAVVLDKEAQTLQGALLDRKGIIVTAFSGVGNEKAFIYLEKDADSAALHFNTQEAKYTVYQRKEQGKIHDVGIEIETKSGRRTVEGNVGTMVGDIQAIIHADALQNVLVLDTDKKAKGAQDDNSDIYEPVTRLTPGQIREITQLHTSLSPLKALPQGSERVALDAFLEAFVRAVREKEGGQFARFMERRFQMYKILLFGGNVDAAVKELEQELMMGYILDTADEAFHPDRFTAKALRERRVHVVIEDAEGVVRQDLRQDESGNYLVSVIMKMRNGSYVAMEHMIYTEQKEGRILGYGFVGGFG